MAKNLFFDFYTDQGAQDLREAMTIEALSIYGHDIWFLPRQYVAKDELYGEDKLSTYDKAYDGEVYIKSFASFEGDGDFLSKFNLEIRDQITFVWAYKTFQEEIGNELGVERPLEGDLIYSRMMKKMFIVKYVEKAATFYQLGKLTAWDVQCEVFEYSNERIRTGIPELDELETEYSFASDGTAVMSNTVFDDVLDTIFADNTLISEEGSGIIDFSEINPFSGQTY